VLFYSESSTGGEALTSDFQENKCNENLAKWQIFSNFIGDNQRVTPKKMKSLDQVCSTDAYAPDHTAKVHNKFDTRRSIMEELRRLPHPCRISVDWTKAISVTASTISSC
jgi:undecaprenyl pyrophosphate synthase